MQKFFCLFCDLDQFDIAKILIDNGADVNAKNNDEDRAIHFATSSGKL